MSDIDELQRRLTAAMDRIGEGVETLPRGPGAAAVDPAELDNLRAALASEQAEKARLQEALNAAQAGGGTSGQDQDKLGALEAQLAEQKTALGEMNREMNRLRKNNAQLREVNQSLRGANETQLGDAHLINKAMLAELEGLRAAQSASETEARAIIDALAPMISPAAELATAQEEV